MLSRLVTLARRLNDILNFVTMLDGIVILLDGFIATCDSLPAMLEVASNRYVIRLTDYNILHSPCLIVLHTACTTIMSTTCLTTTFTASFIILFTASYTVCLTILSTACPVVLSTASPIVFSTASHTILFIFLSILALTASATLTAAAPKTPGPVIGHRRARLEAVEGC